MKIKLPTGLCVLMALALVVFGVFYGTFTGFRSDRAEVEELLENGLETVLEYRGADGMNLCVVARRHLPKDDPDVLALEAAARTLQSLFAGEERCTAGNGGGSHQPQTDGNVQLSGKHERQALSGNAAGGPEQSVCQYGGQSV